MISPNKKSEVKNITGGYDDPRYAPIEQPAKDVVAAYQNANKWLDSIKEVILIELGCPFFSNEIHKLAHTMPGRFDKFGDILHERHLLIHYPETQVIRKLPESMEEAFDMIFAILDDINVSIMNFIDATKDTSLHFMALEAENLLTDINTEYSHLGNARKMLDLSNGNLGSFDRWIAKYYAAKDTLV